MAQPAAPGTTVLWKNPYAEEYLPAIVVQVPLYQPGGVANDDGAGNPVLCNLMVFAMAGLSAKYLVPWADDGSPNTWSLPPAT